MEIKKIHALAGPNIWADFPVLEAWVELGDLKDSPSNEMPGFNDRVMAWLPEMIEHRCSIGERGGFFQRLRNGTYLAHILEHVSLELQARAGTNVGFGRARETTKEGLFRVVIRYEDEPVARACLETGRRLCLAAIYDQPFDVAEEIRRLRLLCDDTGLGPSMQAMVAAARARNIPVTRLNSESLARQEISPTDDPRLGRLNSDSLVQLGYGARQRRIWTAETDRTGAIAEDISKDKELTRALLRQVGVRVPRGRPVKDAGDAWKAATEIGLPVVVKPQAANQAKGLVVGISTREQVEAAFRFAAVWQSGVIVEEMIRGEEHRLLVVGGKFVAATRGNPVFVTGDGRQTVTELIQSQVNSDPRRGVDLSYPLSPIELTDTVKLALEQEGYSLESVPEKDKKVMIQRHGNLAIDVTDRVHPAVAKHVGFAARVIGLDVAGIDVIADDIGRPLEDQGGMIIEVNAGPGLQMHLFPESGTPRPVGEAIVATLFDEGQDGRIPLVAVSGQGRIGDIAKMIAHLMAQSGQTVGLVTAEGTFVDGVRNAAASASRAQAARGLLLNPLVEAAVVELSQESILEEGIAFDRCQVSVLTAMGEGPKLDFEEWDTEHKKSLVFRAVSDVVLPNGAVVFEADEPLGHLIAMHCHGSVILFSSDKDHAALAEHRRSGGRAVFASRNQVTLADSAGDHSLDVDAWHGGLDELLPTVAAAWALGIAPDNIASGLASYRS